MGGLSTFFTRTDPAPPQPPRRVRAGEIDEAVRLLLRYEGRMPDADHVRHFMHYAGERGIDLHQIWVVPHGRRLVAAGLVVLAAGRSGLILSSMPGNDRNVARLTAGCCDAAAAALGPGTSLLQMLLEPAERHFADALTSAGFERLATLIYLQKQTRPTTAACPLRGYQLARYSDETHARFARVINATYTGSLDCPALHGRRAIEDVVAGHKSNGEFDPALWFVLSNDTNDDEGDLGVLLLAPLPGQDAMEIVYVGLTPAARGRRIGDLLLTFAERETARHGEKLLTLAVDAQNAPALRLYYRHGFGELQQRLALVRFLGS